MTIHPGQVFITKRNVIYIVDDVSGKCLDVYKTRYDRRNHSYYRIASRKSIDMDFLDRNLKRFLS